MRVEQGAAPAVVPRKHSSGRPWAAVRPNYVGPPPGRAGRARARRGESRSAREGEESSAQWPEARPRGQKSPQMAQAPMPAWSAGRARHPSPGCPHRMVRHDSAPSRRSAPLVLRGQKEGRRRARAAKNRAGGALGNISPPVPAKAGTHAKAGFPLARDERKSGAV